MSGKVLDGRLGMGVMIWENCGFDTQLWFWDGESIRNKKHPSHVLDLDHRVSFNIGSTYKKYHLDSDVYRQVVQDFSSFFAIFDYFSKWSPPTGIKIHISESLYGGNFILHSALFGFN